MKVPLKKDSNRHVSTINVRLNVPAKNIKTKYNEETDSVEIDIFSEDFEVDIDPIHEMSNKLREQGIDSDICNKVHDTAVDILHQELGMEILKDFMPGYKEFRE